MTQIVLQRTSFTTDIGGIVAELALSDGGLVVRTTLGEVFKIGAEQWLVENLCGCAPSNRSQAGFFGLGPAGPEAIAWLRKDEKNASGGLSLVSSSSSD